MSLTGNCRYKSRISPLTTMGYALVYNLQLPASKLLATIIHSNKSFFLLHRVRIQEILKRCLAGAIATILRHRHLHHLLILCLAALPLPSNMQWIGFAKRWRFPLSQLHNSVYDIAILWLADLMCCGLSQATYIGLILWIKSRLLGR